MANINAQLIMAELEALQKELTQFKSTVEYLNGAKSHLGLAVDSVQGAQGELLGQVEELKKLFAASRGLTDSIAMLVAKIDGVNFPERLESIENAVKATITTLDETNQSTHEDLQKAAEIITEADFEGKFKNLRASVEASVKANADLAKKINDLQLPEKIGCLEKNVMGKLDASVAEFEKTTKETALKTSKTILDLNLPVRIDKLDATTAGILSAVQLAHSRIESVERNIGDRLAAIGDKLSGTMEKHHEASRQSLASIGERLEESEKKQSMLTYVTWGLIIIGWLAMLIFSRS